MDILKQLMSDVRKELRLRRLRRIAQACVMRGSIPSKGKYESTYTKAENWIAGRIVVLIHQETGEVLGEFQEYHHRLSPSARRLTKVDGGLAGLLADPPIEYVKGEHWLHPCPAEIPEVEYTPQDIAAMQKRFFELMEGS